MSSLDIPEAVTTSEQASRYLRSKTKDVGPLIVFAQALIDEKYVNLYFPRKEDFLMDWWFDRAEIGMKNDDFWQIFKKIWTSLSAGSKRQIYQRHKFLDTIKSALALLASDVTNNDSQKTERLALLSSIFDAVECVEQSKVWLRCTTEVMVSIVIDYLKLVSVFPEAASEKWCRLVFSIYENALYGVSNFKKISQSFSNNGLLAGFTVLKQVDRQAKLHDKLSNILRDLVFSPSVVKDDENQLFKKLCDVLAQIPDSRQDSDFLGHVLSLGLSKFGKTKQRSLMPKICEEFLNFAPQAARSILREAKNHDITISTQSLTKALHAQEPTDWSLATMILDGDADAVFPMVEGLMDDKLRNSETSRDIVAFVCQLADSYTKIRNLQLFINIWRKTLTRGVPETSVLVSEDLVRAVATRISENLTINQLNSIFVEIIPKDETGELMSGDILPLIAIILGTSLLPDTLPDSLLLKAEKLLSLLNAEALQDNYLAWRLKYLILSMDKNIVKSVIESLYTGASDVASAVKSLVNPDRKVYDSRIQYFNLQMLFRIAEFKPLTGFPQVAQWLLDIMDAKSLQWDQNIANIGTMNLPVAFAFCIIDRWLVLIEYALH
ncbi:hypothetical protein POJ06DRAFT_281646 [Lipomyces tetrasporus]|uniref:Uncharacterized protein n=1 Tax=Lipomyces tetrasporus TaxID=54092 RepID=A0AAD7VTZ6_9ASCO|nr:uncharacterized protein POJ06DRAFT_281646 [Lipomyces tetrasporus]KAJ8100675.1 hypothetical protein POJ06DRAFT_281646 [Lipomyces tetrasporus]